MGSDMVAALFVAKNGPYFGIPNVDPWDEARDARRYSGPWPVVAHPPCERWGRYATGGPNPKAVRRVRGDDGGCFAAALDAVLAFGGVLEHPAGSSAWAHFGILPPPMRGWESQLYRGRLVWCCQVEQGHYGHRARKATWLLASGVTDLPALQWGPSSKRARLEDGFHTREERARARAAGIMPIKRISARDRIHTPEAFRGILLRLAASAHAGLSLSNTWGEMNA